MWSPGYSNHQKLHILRISGWLLPNKERNKRVSTTHLVHIRGPDSANDVMSRRPSLLEDSGPLNVPYVGPDSNPQERDGVSIAFEALVPSTECRVLGHNEAQTKTSNM